MNIYVCGFAENNGNILFIKKNRGPDAVVGKLNGVGGKVEPEESAHDAMVREFQEEVGVLTKKEDWEQKLVYDLIDNDNVVYSRVYFFITQSDKSTEARQCEDEVILWVDWKDIPSVEKVENLNWILPYLFDNNNVVGCVFAK